MTVAAIKNKLYDYIRVADDKKLQAIYQLLEADIEKEYEWWKDKAFVSELDRRHNSLESGADKGIDEVVHVSAPIDMRIKRVMQRDGVSKEDVERRMAKQWTDEQREAQSQHRIVNDEQRLLLPQVLALHALFMQK